MWEECGWVLQKDGRLAEENMSCLKSDNPIPTVGAAKKKKKNQTLNPTNGVVDGVGKACHPTQTELLSKLLVSPLPRPPRGSKIWNPRILP